MEAGIVSGGEVRDRWGRRVWLVRLHRRFLRSWGGSEILVRRWLEVVAGFEGEYVLSVRRIPRFVSGQEGRCRLSFGGVSIGLRLAARRG
jgi:hypothetical protein